MNSNGADYKPPILTSFRRKLVGTPRDFREPSVFHKLSLIPILAWIGLGADGLSSSSYGPEEAFKAMGPHTYLAAWMAVATALTIVVISYAYSRIIEHFPHGGGGYIVASHTISPKAGVLSGSALLVDYVLTITVSLASCSDALFSFLPVSLHAYKVPFAAILIVLLVILNLRGIKESVLILAPIFALFVITHVALLGYGILTHAGRLRPLVAEFHGTYTSDLATIGFLGVLAVFLRAFSMGAGTYTGLEAVSNGVPIMREPRVRSAKQTMLYLAVSLAVTAGGLLLCYSLFSVKPVHGRTLNSVLAGLVFGDWPIGGVVALVTILSEGALLVVAAQTGFVDGPRVMANMAVDRWFPHRFSLLSERLTMQNGVLLMGLGAVTVLLYTGGSVSALVVMYSINVFLTFSLSQFGMARFYLTNRKTDKKWRQRIAIHVVGLVLCLTILCVTVFEKFLEGGWLTLVVTSVLILVCYLIKKHYSRVGRGVRKVSEILADIPRGGHDTDKPLDPKEPTAILLVSGYNGFGLHIWLTLFKQFPGLYKNFVFVTVAELDSGSFKGAAELEALRESTQKALEKYVSLCRSYGFPAEHRMDSGIDVVETATALCAQLAREYPNSAVFSAKAVFRSESIFHRLLHNDTAFAIQRRLQMEGITTVILPVRITF